MRIALGAGLAVLAVALGFTLSRSPPSALRANSTQEENFGYNEQGLTACQAGELLPAGTTAVRLELAAFTGPPVVVKALDGNRIVAHGARGAGWTGRTVTVPLALVPKTSSQVKMCFGWKLRGAESVAAYGQLTGRAKAARLDDGSPAPGRVNIEYLHSGNHSWLSMAGTVIRHMSLGRAASGEGIVVLAILLMVAVLALSSHLMLKELR